MSDQRRDSDFSRQEPAGAAGGGFDLGRFDPKDLARAGLGSPQEQERFQRALSAGVAEAPPARQRERGHPMNAFNRETRQRDPSSPPPGRSAIGSNPAASPLAAAAPELDRNATQSPSNHPEIQPAVALETAMPHTHVAADDNPKSRDDDVMGLYEDFMGGLLGSGEPVLEQRTADTESVEVASVASVDFSVAVNESAELRGEQSTVGDLSEESETGFDSPDSPGSRFRSALSQEPAGEASRDEGVSSKRVGDDTPTAAELDGSVGGGDHDLGAVEREASPVVSADAMIALVAPSLPPFVELPLMPVPRVKVSAAAQPVETEKGAQAADAERGERFKELITQADSALAPEKAAFRTRMRGLSPFFGEDPQSRKRFEDFLMFISERKISGDNPALVLFELMGVTKAISDAGIDGIRKADAQTGAGIATVAQALLDALADQGDAVSGNMREALNAATRQLHDILSSFAAQGAVTHQALENSARKATRASESLAEQLENIPMDLGRDLRETVNDAAERLDGILLSGIVRAQERAEGFGNVVLDSIQAQAHQTIDESIDAVEKSADRVLEFAAKMDKRFEAQQSDIDARVASAKSQVAAAGQATSEKAAKDLILAINAATARSVKELNAAAVSAANTYDTLRQASDERRAKKERFANAVMQGAVSLGVCIGCVALYAVCKAVFF